MLLAGLHAKLSDKLDFKRLPNNKVGRKIKLVIFGTSSASWFN
jgi:hypothetical protein